MPRQKDVEKREVWGIEVAAKEGRVLSVQARFREPLRAHVRQDLAIVLDYEARDQLNNGSVGLSFEPLHRKAVGQKFSASLGRQRSEPNVRDKSLQKARLKH